jgi:NADPH2:quinone reductase
MRAIQLLGFEGSKSLKLVDITPPAPGANELLIEVKAAGINYADTQQALGKYPTYGQELPFVPGFEAAGTVRELGTGVAGFKPGDRVVASFASGGYAELAVAPATATFPLPSNLSFAHATAIPIQGMSAYTMLKYAAMPAAPRSILVQSAAGGVGLFLVQIAKLFGIEKIIALASSSEKLELLKSLGADATINYTQPDWPEQVRQFTGGEGVDVVLQMSTGSIGEESFKLAARGGRIVIFGAQNYHDAVSTKQVRQLIWLNQTLVGFAYPSLLPAQVAESLPPFLDLIREGKLRIFAETVFPLSKASDAFEALLSRKMIGKVVLEP